MFRSLLFIPGNQPGMIQNADVFGADGVIFDLEDAVAPTEKDAARQLLIEASRDLTINCERILRINGADTDDYAKDLAALKQLPVSYILFPKAEAESFKTLKEDLEVHNLPQSVIALIETPLGVEEAFTILRDPRCVGVMLGGEDLTASMGVERTLDGVEILYARLRLVNAAKAANKLLIDTPFTSVDHIAGLKKDCQFARGIGFDGKAAIHPKQIDAINEAFQPTEEAIQKAIKIIRAKLEAEKLNEAVFSVDGKMVDKPIILRAERTLLIARKLGLVNDEEDIL